MVYMRLKIKAICFAYCIVVVAQDTPLVLCSLSSDVRAYVRVDDGGGYMNG